MTAGGRRVDDRTNRDEPLPVLSEARATCVISRDPGLHVRAAAVFVRLAQRFRSEVVVEGCGTRAAGNSIVELLGLAACRGATLEIIARGPDATRAAHALAELVEHDFMDDWT